MDKTAHFITGRTLAANGDAREDDDELCMQAQGLMFGYNVSMVLGAAIQLGLLDALVDAADGNAAVTAAELTERIQQLAAGPPPPRRTKPVWLSRWTGFSGNGPGLWAPKLALNVVRCSTETGPDGTAVRRYMAAPLCRWVAGNNGVQGSLSPFAVYLVDEDHLLPWHHLLAAAVAGGGPTTAFERAHGLPYYDYMARKNQRLSALFDNAMAQHSVILVTKMLERFKGFDGVRRLVDAGGGTGSTLGMITSRHKHITGINYDLPHVISQALPFPGVEHVAGNMYESAYPLEMQFFCKYWILLMLSDEDCIRILKNCHQALPEDGRKVIIVDGLLPEHPDTTQAARDSFTQDMCVLTQFGGKQRTEKELAKLAKECGFNGVVRSTYIFLNFYAIELSK
ncbi:hypothetical protein GUJ93_ZPchr0006g43110 [Zizania palustris]|uniref:O-methyltransferase domain-containing protein n=1 Tax=Zizania palustris TaxID=103762 RepID=A0A8J5S8G6_ZIZPA|nr:hypothetical protein GUJ93_ZPchr0006g43110 [Zizania palustris]